MLEKREKETLGGGKSGKGSCSREGGCVQMVDIAWDYSVDDKDNPRYQMYIICQKLPWAFCALSHSIIQELLRGILLSSLFHRWDWGSEKLEPKSVRFWSWPRPELENSGPQVTSSLPSVFIKFVTHRHTHLSTHLYVCFPAMTAQLSSCPRRQ